MTGSGPVTVGQRQWLVPLPLIVDADVLLRNVEYCVRMGWTPRLLESASTNYTLVTGVLLFATLRVQEEVERHLPDVAKRRGVTNESVLKVWNNIFLPRIRIVDVDARLEPDPRVDRVRELDESDTPTAALAVMLAPCVLLTDNRKHFAPLGLPDERTDDIAVDAHALSRYLLGANAAMLVPAMGGAAVMEGSKKLIDALGKDGALLVGLIAVGLVFLYWRSESGGRVRESVKAMAHELGPQLVEALEQGRVLSDKISALAIEPKVGPTTALAFMARELATSQTVMPTAEVARRLRGAGYRFTQHGDFRTHVRAWLVDHDCFFEARRGQWTLGYHLSTASHGSSPPDDG